MIIGDIEPVCLVSGYGECAECGARPFQSLTGQSVHLLLIVNIFFLLVVGASSTRPGDPDLRAHLKPRPCSLVSIQSVSAIIVTGLDRDYPTILP